MRKCSKMKSLATDEGSSWTNYCTCSGAAKKLAGAEDNGSVEKNVFLTDISQSGILAHLSQMAAEDRVARARLLFMDHSMSSLGRHAVRITTGEGINNSKALSSSSKTKHVNRVAVVKRKCCTGR